MQASSCRSAATSSSKVTAEPVLPASELAAALDDHLYSLNAAIHTDSGEPRYPKPPKTYLEDWAATDPLVGMPKGRTFVRRNTWST